MNEDELLKRTADYTREIDVPVSKLHLDPNNPRFVGERPEQVPPGRYLEDQVINETFELMSAKRFEIDKFI